MSTGTLTTSKPTKGLVLGETVNCISGEIISPEEQTTGQLLDGGGGELYYRAGDIYIAGDAHFRSLSRQRSYALVHLSVTGIPC
jgi:hypothetical protein